MRTLTLIAWDLTRVEGAAGVARTLLQDWAQSGSVSGSGCGSLIALSFSVSVCLGVPGCAVCAALTNRSLCVCVCDDDDESQGWGRRSRTRYLTAQRTKLNWSQVGAQFKSTTQKTQTQPSPTRRTEQPNERLPSSIVPSLRRCFVAVLPCRFGWHAQAAGRVREMITHTYLKCVHSHRHNHCPLLEEVEDCLSFSYNLKKDFIF